MTILDRYIIRSFLYSYLVSLVALLGLFVVFDALSHLDDFLQVSADGNRVLGVMTLLMQYYGARVPIIFHAICPAILLIGAMFTLAQLNRNNELTAMRAVGISMYRTLAPVFGLTVLITGLLVLDQEVVIPSLLDRIRASEDLVSGGSRNIHKRLDVRDRFGNRLQVAYYRVYEQKMEGDVLVSAYYPGSSQLRVQVKATEAVWKRMPDGLERWVLSNGNIMALDTDGGEIPPREWAWNIEPEFGKEGFVLLRPEDRAQSAVQIQTDFTPRDMVPMDVTLGWRSTADIRKHLQTSGQNTQLSVVLAGRYAFPLSNLVLLLLGLPFVLGAESRSTFVGLAICIVICAAFYGVNALCVELGNRGALTPTAAAWLPIVLFMPTGVLLFDGVKT